MRSFHMQNVSLTQYIQYIQSVYKLSESTRKRKLWNSELWQYQTLIYM